MRRVLAVILAALLAGCSTLQGSAPAAQGSPVIARIVESGSLRVGMSGNQPPLNFKSRSGRLLGLWNRPLSPKDSPAAE
jgi:ABC-type amino acid transport substrate-binding protein